MDASNNDLQLGKWLAGAAVGALVMYMLDPDYGAPRRAETGKKLSGLGKQTGAAINQAVHQLGSGVEHAATSMGGTVGSIAREAGHALKGIAERELGAPLEPVDAASAHRTGKGLDGDRSAGNERASPSVVQSFQNGAGSLSRSLSGGDALAWSSYPGQRPASGIRLAALAGGSMLGVVGMLAPRSLLTIAAGLAGIALLARASSRKPLHTMIGAGTRARPVEVERTIRIDASPEQVFDLFADYENFPRFMSNVVQVRDLGGGRSHWIVKGPGGTEFAWTAALTEHDRPNRLSWRSEPGAEVEQNGTITFEPFRNGTRVTVHMAYRPPAGAVGHALARLLGRDPGHEMDEDLMRMKMLVERKAMPAGGKVTGAEARYMH